MHEENVTGIQVEIEGLPPWCKVVDVAGSFATTILTCSLSLRISRIGS